MKRKIRLDRLLIERSLVESREQGRRLIMAGEVRVAGQTVHRPSTLVRINAPVEIVSRPRFVSRGGEKLQAALEGWQLNMAGAVCADVGASTGGFTDCLLQYGAARVYAIDVGKGILHWRLRDDERVIVMEKTNARYVPALPERVDWVTIDAAFISLKLLLPVAQGWLTPRTGQIVALVKPQFEAGPAQVGKGGVVRDPAVHAAVLRDVLHFASQRGLCPNGLMRSPLRGPAGNVEFLAWLTQGAGCAENIREKLDALIDACVFPEG